ncbi:MAG: hypothetical protein JW841_12955 [Deltaproteobacteria bacterium]|nr:hypothetical protein [Deltaproteobacteria bacterium]
MRALYKTAGSKRFYDVINRAVFATHYRKVNTPYKPLAHFDAHFDLAVWLV